MSKTISQRGKGYSLSTGKSFNTAALQIAGISAITFAFGVLVANIAMAGTPLPDSSASEAQIWYEENRIRIIIANALVGLTFPAILAFGAAMYELAREHPGAFLLLITGFGNTFVAGGSAFAFIGFAGFLAWLIWIIIVGFRLLRLPVIKAD